MVVMRVAWRLVAIWALGLSIVGLSNLPAGAATCLGTSGPDNISCSSGDDYIDGFGGNDNLDGLAGFDEIHGGGGHDFMHGNNGNDSMWGESGNDVVVGNSGNDDLHDTNPNDTDYMCGLAGSSDEIWINDGDPDDVLWDGTGTFHVDGGDTINLSETSCP
jgi:Ca2+-binding RTX toxin-like protein